MAVVGSRLSSPKVGEKNGGCAKKNEEVKERGLGFEPEGRPGRAVIYSVCVCV